ncbi:hypothetical protein MC28_C004 (plasmid) [Bacillus thuringiensis MC28]|nr:hypothetical protein MC28_C004 [Bacillus thuringiensis MC28]
MKLVQVQHKKEASSQKFRNIRILKSYQSIKCYNYTVPFSSMRRILKP